MSTTALRLAGIFGFVTASVSSAACGGNATGPDGGGTTTPQEAGFDTSVCNADGVRESLAGVTPATATDYLELRSSYAGSSTAPRVTASTGTRCSGASDARACNAAFDALAPTDGWPGPVPYDMPQSTIYLAFTRGNEAGTVTSRDALGAFLAPLSLSDAAFIVEAHGYRIVCTENNAVAKDGGTLVLGETGIACGAGTKVERHLLFVSASGSLEVRSTWTHKEGDPGCAIGRRPDGLASGSDAIGATVGAYLAACAHLEAASVVAFERLEAELARFGAPDELRARALRAAQDETRHAAVVGRLAEERGGVVEAVRTAPFQERSLVAMALENAVEGCVRETYGALVARWQSDHAADASVRTALATIADEETQHAALAWDIAAWVLPQLTTEERARVAAAQEAAVLALATTLTAEEPSDAVVSETGLPTAAQASMLLREVAPALWGARLATWRAEA